MNRVAHRTGNFIGAGGLRLFYQCWKPAGRSKAVLAIIHGMAEHSGRYGNPVDYFAKHGFTLYAMDLRGHGLSGGRRAYAESIEELLEDLRSFLTMVKKSEPSRKVFLVGHSFGGQLVLNYGAHFPNSLGGIIVSSPNIRLALKVALWKKLAAPVLSSIVPKLMLTNDIDPSFISRDRQVVEAYKRDERVEKKITARLGDLLLANHLEIMDVARRFKVPCLLLHAGEDRICAPEGTEQFFQRIPIKDKTLKIYDGFYHELFNDPGKEEVFQDMENWIEKRI